MPALSRQGKKTQGPAVAGPGRLPSDRPREGQGRVLVRLEGASPSDAMTDLPRRGHRQLEEATHIFGRELRAQGCPKVVEAEVSEILVEIAECGRQGTRLDSGPLRALVQTRHGDVSGQIAVAGDIEAGERGWEQQ